MAKDKKESSLTYWEKRAVEQDAELHKGIKKPESAILSAYIQAQEYLKAEAKKIYDRYVQQPGMTESMFEDILNTKASDRDLVQLASMAKSVHDKQVKKQIQAYLNALAAKARISRLEMLRAKAYVVAKQLADVQLRQEEAFLTKAAQQAYQQAAVEAVIGKTTRDVRLHTPDAIPNQRKLPNAIVFENSDTGEVVKELALKPESSVKQFTQLSNTQTQALLDTHWVGGNYSTRIWGNTDQLAKRLQQLFTAQQMSGMTERDITQAIQKEFNVGAYVARRLIRTEANFVAGQAKLRGWREHGVKQYVLIAVLDFRTSSICREKDGQVFNVTDAHCDGPKGNYPPFHSFCRTVASAYYGKETFVGKHKVNNPLGRPIEMPAGTTYHEWEAELNRRYGQEAVLAQKKVESEPVDRKLFDRYRELMSDDVPERFEEFQNLKYTENRDWQLLQLDYNRRMRLAKDPSLGLPNAKAATAAEAKFTKYLFNPDNPKGWDKGKAFSADLGYNDSNWSDLQSALQDSASKFPSRLKRTDQYGDHYEQQVILKGTNGHVANVIVGWTAKDGETWMASAYIKSPKKGE